MFAVPTFDKCGCWDLSRRRRCRGHDPEYDPLAFCDRADPRCAPTPQKIVAANCWLYFATGRPRITSKPMPVDQLLLRASQGGRRSAGSGNCSLRDLGQFPASWRGTTLAACSSSAISSDVSCDTATVRMRRHVFAAPRRWNVDFPSGAIHVATHHDPFILATCLETILRLPADLPNRKWRRVALQARLTNPAGSAAHTAPPGGRALSSAPRRPSAPSPTPRPCGR